MANTYSLIASSTVGVGGAATVSFTSIPASYTDLCVVFSGRSSTDTPICYGKVTLNSDTGNNYSWKFLYGTGSAAASTGLSSTNGFQYVIIAASNSTANTFGNSSFYIPNYTSSNQKSITIDAVSENNGTVATQGMLGGLWTGTAAITRIDITETVLSFAQYTTAYLYGVKNA